MMADPGTCRRAGSEARGLGCAAAAPSAVERAARGPPVALGPHAPPRPGPARHAAAVRRRPAAPVGAGCRRPRRRGGDPRAGAGRGRPRRDPLHGGAGQGRRVRRPAGAPERHRAGPRHASTRTWRGPRGGLRPHPRLPRPRGRATGRPRRRRHHGRAPDAAGRAGRHLRPGRPGPLPLDRAHVRRAGPGGRRGEHRPVRAAGRPTARSTPRRCVPPRSRASTRSTGSAVRRPSPPWRTGPRACPRSTSSPGRATRTWPRPSARCPVSWAWPRPSPARPRSSWSPAPTRRRPSPPSTSSCRPSTGPTAWPGWSAGTPPSLEAVSAEVDRIVAASSRRADLESTLATSGIACLVDGPERGDGRGQHRRPRAPAADGARGRGRGHGGAGAERRCRVHRRLVAGQHGGLHRRAQPRAAHQPDGALRLGAAGRRLPQAPAHRPRDARGVAHPRARTWSRWPRPRACPPTPTPCGAAWPRSTSEAAP